MLGLFVKKVYLFFGLCESVCFMQEALALLLARETETAEEEFRLCCLLLLV